MTNDELAALEANDGFYAAFAARDIARMDALWARERPVTCIHPGWSVLIGRVAVMDSWRAILRDDTVRIECSSARAYVAGEMAYVVCFEGARAEAPNLVATNVFGREQGTWKLVHHHAGHLADVPTAPPSGPTN
jgi:ketosteroid isomerase-like protein